MIQVFEHVLLLPAQAQLPICNLPSQFQSHTQRYSPMTCRLDASVGLVSNPEALQLLHERGCHLGPVGNSLPAEQKVCSKQSSFKLSCAV